MNEKKTGSMRRKGTISDTIVHVLLAVLAVIWVIPILWIVLLSFSSQKGSYVTTFFPKGYTLHNYIVSKRLLMARSLIDQGMPVIKAAQESGFAEYSTFSRAYRKQFQQSPGASKKQQTL